MSQAPRRINTQRSLNRPTEQRPTEAPASRPAPLQGQPLDPMSKAAYEDIHAQVEARAGTT